MGKVIGCPKGIGLGNIFRRILWEKKKVTDFFFFTTFYIFHKSGIKIFLNGTLTNALKASVNRSLELLISYYS